MYTEKRSEHDTSLDYTIKRCQFNLAQDLRHAASAQAAGRTEDADYYRRMDELTRKQIAAYAVYLANRQYHRVHVTVHVGD